MKKSFKLARDPGALMGLEVDMARQERDVELSYDDLGGGKSSSFALVEDAVKLYGRNPDHYNNASFEEEFKEEKPKKQ